MTKFTEIRMQIATLKAEVEAIRPMNEKNYKQIIALNDRILNLYDDMIRSQRISYAELESEFA